MIKNCLSGRWQAEPRFGGHGAARGEGGRVTMLRELELLGQTLEWMDSQLDASELKSAIHSTDAWWQAATPSGRHWVVRWVDLSCFATVRVALRRSIAG